MHNTIYMFLLGIYTFRFDLVAGCLTSREKTIGNFAEVVEVLFSLENCVDGIFVEYMKHIRKLLLSALNYICQCIFFLFLASRPN